MKQKDAEDVVGEKKVGREVFPGVIGGGKDEGQEQGAVQVKKVSRVCILVVFLFW